MPTDRRRSIRACDFSSRVSHGHDPCVASAFLGLKSSLSDAPRGVVLFVVGLLVVFMTRFRTWTERRRIE